MAKEICSWGKPGATLMVPADGVYPIPAFQGKEQYDRLIAEGWTIAAEGEYSIVFVR